MSYDEGKEGMTKFSIIRKFLTFYLGVFNRKNSNETLNKKLEFFYLPYRKDLGINQENIGHKNSRSILTLILSLMYSFIERQKRNYNRTKKVVLKKMDSIRTKSNRARSGSTFDISIKNYRPVLKDSSNNKKSLDGSTKLIPQVENSNKFEMNSADHKGNS